MKPMIALALLFPAVAVADIDARCVDVRSEVLQTWDEQRQVDFLQNFIALSTSYSGIHAPIPHEPGHGGISLDLSVIPPLSCARRFALNATKTEDTNKTPVVPRPRISFALPLSDTVVPYGSVAYFPPITLFGTRNVILSGEVGVGVRLGEQWMVGGRFHATQQKTVADAATPFEAGQPGAPDLYLASTFGVDLSVGFEVAPAVRPYLSVGLLDASTFFWIGEDGVVSNNVHPYLGPVAALGADGLLVKDRLRWGVELFAAPGGHSTPDADFPTLPGLGTYGHLYTARFRVGIEI